MCDTIVIVESDRVLFAKNSDRDPNEAQLLDWQPRRTFAPDATLRCTWIEIPQVAVTHAVLLSRPYWMWGAEMGANEHGVVIGNEAVFTRQPYAATGLTGMDLLRLALERCDSARHAVECIVELLEQFGQGGGCGHENPNFTYHNSFLIADPRGAFVLETAGPHHAVEEVNGARSISNGLTIAGFAEAYTDRIKSRVASCAIRQRRTQKLAERAQGTGDMMALLRDHGVGRTAPHYSLVNGGMAAPCMHAGGLAAASQTTASWVAELSPGGVQHWATGTACPCVSLFKPVAVHDPLDLSPDATAEANGESLWWRGEALHRLAVRNPESLYPLFAAERDELEASWRAAPPASGEAFAIASERLESWTRAVAERRAPDMRPVLVRRYWGKRDRASGFAALSPAVA